MNNFKKIIAASGAEVTAGGVTWDATSVNNGVSASFNFQQWFSGDAYGVGADGQETLVSGAAVAPGAGELVGVGEFDGFFQSRGVGFAFNPTVCATCELTYAFGGLVIDAITPTEVIYNTDNAWLHVYFDETPDFGNLVNTTDTAYTELADAQDGTLWASFSFDSFAVEGTLLGGVANIELSVESGLADVVAALDYNNGIADIAMTSSSSFANGEEYSVQSNGQLANKVPEPTTLAIFGLALLGLAGASRRKA
jgi:hypothetical protein